MFVNSYLNFMLSFMASDGRFYNYKAELLDLMAISVSGTVQLVSVQSVQSLYNSPRISDTRDLTQCRWR